MKIDNKFIGAYSGSLVCRDFSEIDDFHGYLLWDLSKNEVNEIEIENKYSFRIININQFTDFDNLDIEIDKPTEFIRVKFIWKGYSSQYNTTNRNKLKQYLNDKYNIIEFKDSKQFLNETQLEVENESDLNIEKVVTKEGQQKLFTEYLTQLGYDESFITKVLDLDHEINNRLNEVEHENIIWKPLILRGKNFKSFDNFEIDFRNYNGVLQITGKNQVGKTTAYSLLSYVLYGKIVETEKVEKNGDNRFINNRINDDYCWGENVFEANNQYYGVRRTTNRKWNRAKTEITGVSTTINYYLLSNPDDEFNESNSLDILNEDVKKKTQRVIDSIINNYNNFKLLALTTSDTLNEILKVDKADFIDNILFNLGMDFFDKKLAEAKLYKKEYQENNTKINIVLENEEKNIKLNEATISDNELAIKTHKNNISEFKKRYEKGKIYKDDLIKKLIPIDDELTNLVVSTVETEINTLELKIEDKRKIYVLNNKKIKTLPKKFDDTKLKELNSECNKKRELIFTKKDEINTVKSKITSIESDISKLKTSDFYLNKENESLLKENDRLETSKFCPTCKQSLKDGLVGIKENIDKNLQKIEENKTSIINNSKEIKVLENNILKEKENIILINKDIDQINIDNEKLLIEIGAEEGLRNEFLLRSELILKNENIKLEGETITNKIQNLKDKINRYNDNLSSIELNKKTNVKINEADGILDSINNDIVQNERNISTLENNINNTKVNIKNIKQTITKFNKQVEQENIMSVYEKCVHRNGVPTLLLKKYSLPEINRMLNDLLREVPFNVHLDEETLRLKMSDISDSTISIDCICGSGKERTFSAIALKYCLNELNIKSKPEILILDEVTGKLVGDSVTEFVDILKVLSTKIGNIIIIEHVHDMQPDYVMEIVKDSKGISYIENII